jgi:hypothetical protein
MTPELAQEAGLIDGIYAADDDNVTPPAVVRNLQDLVRVLTCGAVSAAEGTLAALSAVVLCVLPRSLLTDSTHTCITQQLAGPGGPAVWRRAERGALWAVKAKRQSVQRGAPFCSRQPHVAWV